MATRYVDGELSVTTATYSIADRDDSGSDGDGYPTVGEAITAASADDILFIRGAGSTFNGVYEEADGTDVGFPSDFDSFNINKPLTLEGYQEERPTLTYDPAEPPKTPGVAANFIGDVIGILSTTGDVTVKKIKVIGTKALGDQIEEAADRDTDVTIRIVTSSAISITIEDCEITDSGHAAIKEGGGLGAVDLLIDKCRIFRGGFKDRDHGSYLANITTGSYTVRRCIISGIFGYGIHMFEGDSGGFIHHNVIVGNGLGVSGGGILIQWADVKVYSNTFVDNQINVTLRGTQCNGNVLKNNIFYHNSNVDINIDSSGGSSHPFNNQGFNNNLSTISRSTGEPTDYAPTADFITDPGLRESTRDDENIFDFAIVALSNCRNRGTDVSADGADLRNYLDPVPLNTVPVQTIDRTTERGWDVGAFAWLPEDDITWAPRTGSSVGSNKLYKY